MKNGDLYMWEEMVKENELDTRLRAVRNKKYCAILRSHAKKSAGSRR